MNVFTAKGIVFLLNNADQYRKGTRLKDYPSIGQEAFGKVGKLTVQFFLYTVIFGVSCLYLIFVGTKTHDIMTNNFEFERFSSKFYFFVSGFVILVPILCFKTIKKAHMLSLFGFVATLIVVLVCIIYSLIKYSEKNIVIHREYHFIVPKRMFMALPLISFSFGGSAVYPNIEAQMKNKASWNKLIIISMLLMMGLFLLIGISGYFVYAQNVINPITDNMSTKIKATINGLLVLHLLLTIPLIVCSLCSDIEDEYFTKVIETYFNCYTQRKSNLIKITFRIVFRVIVVAFAVIVASYVSYFNEFMALVGSFSNSAIAFVIPIVCHFKLFGIKNRSVCEYIWIVVTVLVGTMSSIPGAIESIQEIIKKLSA